MKKTISSGYVSGTGAGVRRLVFDYNTGRLAPVLYHVKSGPIAKRCSHMLHKKGMVVVEMSWTPTGEEGDFTYTVDGGRRMPSPSWTYPHLFDEWMAPQTSGDSVLPVESLAERNKRDLVERIVKMLHLGDLTPEEMHQWKVSPLDGLPRHPVKVNNFSEAKAAILTRQVQSGSLVQVNYIDLLYLRKDGVWREVVIDDTDYSVLDENHHIGETYEHIGTQLYSIVDFTGVEEAIILTKGAYTKDHESYGYRYKWWAL
jgi:hypothetical protein